MNIMLLIKHNYYTKVRVQHSVFGQGEWSKAVSLGTLL